MARYEFRSPGGGFGEGIGAMFPPVIKWLMIINVAIFLLQNTLFELGDINAYIHYFGSLWPFGSGRFWPWQLLTYQFLHGSFGHVFFNMLALWMFGMEIEREMGSKKFLLFYLLCGIGGGLINILINPLIGGAEAPTVGASGAIYGILVAFAMYYPDRPVFMFPFFIPIQARFLILIWIALDIIPLILRQNTGTAYLAHLGGGLVGFLLLKFGEPAGVFNLGEKISGMFKKKVSTVPNGNLRYVPTVKEAEFRPAQKPREIFSYEGEEITQAQIDEILDKISQSGYQSLSDREKKILTEVSKRM